MDTNASTTNSAPDKNKPGKYIRTFEGDMKVMKEGGIPDLAPLTQSQPLAPLGHPVASVSIAPLPPVPVTIPVSVQIPKPIPSPPPQTQSSQQQFIRVSEPPPPPATSLKTYANDFNDRMKETHSSTATVLAAEQDSATGNPQATAEKPSRYSVMYIVASVVLLVAGGIGAYFSYTSYLGKTQLIVFAPVVSAPIFVDEREKVSGASLALFQAISKSVAEPIASGAVRLIYIESSTTTPDSVFSALRAPAPDILLRNVNANGSMAGVVNVDGSQSPFFILSVASYSETFSGMLQWEPLMQSDLKQIFSLYPPPIQNIQPATSTLVLSTKKVSPSATSTPSTPIAQPVFLDDSVANHDVRIYRDLLGRSILVYGYWNRTTLVIARDPVAFSEILQRLAISRAP